jgi:superoxide dismutase
MATIRPHHDKHHQAYVTDANSALESYFPIAGVLTGGRSE